MGNGTDIILYQQAMRSAINYAVTSRDPSTQNSALLFDGNGQLLAHATNAFPNGVRANYKRWHTRPQKYFYVEHAERAVIYSAAMRGISTRGLTMVAVWASCADCARAIISSGITTLVRYQSPDHERWAESTEIGEQMLKEAGVAVITLTDPLPDTAVLLRNGKEWSAHV